MTKQLNDGYDRSIDVFLNAGGTELVVAARLNSADFSSLIELVKAIGMKIPQFDLWGEDLAEFANTTIDQVADIYNLPGDDEYLPGFTIVFKNEEYEDFYFEDLSRRIDYLYSINAVNLNPNLRGFRP